MRYWYPFQSDTLLKIKSSNIILFPLYPHYSFTTTGSSLSLIKKNMKPDANVKISVVPYWYNHPRYVVCLSQQINRELEMFSDEEKK